MDKTPLIYAFQNKSTETMPAFGIGRLKSVLATRLPGGEPVYELVKPDGKEGIYVVSNSNVAANKFGSGVSILEATVVRINDAATGTSLPAFGKEIGPEKDKWYATNKGVGLLCMDVKHEHLVPVQKKTSSGGLELWMACWWSQRTDDPEAIEAGFPGPYVRARKITLASTPAAGRRAAGLSIMGNSIRFAVSGAKTFTMSKEDVLNDEDLEDFILPHFSSADNFQAVPGFYMWEMTSAEVLATYAFDSYFDVQGAESSVPLRSGQTNMGANSSYSMLSTMENVYFPNLDSFHGGISPGAILSCTRVNGALYLYDHNMRSNAHWDRQTLVSTWVTPVPF